MAYLLREAFSAARFHADFRKYGRLRSYIQVKAHAASVTIEWVDRDILPYLDDDTAPSTQPDTRTIEQESPIQDLLATMLEMPKTVYKVYFKRPILSPDDMETVFRWASETGWSMIDHEEAGITLTKEPIDNDLKWKPESEMKGN